MSADEVYQRKVLLRRIARKEGRTGPEEARKEGRTGPEAARKEELLRCLYWERGCK